MRQSNRNHLTKRENVATLKVHRKKTKVFQYHKRALYGVSDILRNRSRKFDETVNFLPPVWLEDTIVVF